ncbi:MAG: hypothetical protein IJF65_06600 [Clostridia bacterium]|nr:hypothetical protein [Clostridia bacterium]
MGETVWVGLLSLIGTCVGSLAGILTANKLVNYRLQMLESKVNRHNHLIERTYQLEGRMNEAEHDIRELKRRG